LHAQAIDGLFSTHPKTENRVARLREMAGVEDQDNRSGPWT
jgi:heat shock protein HtpX